MKKTLLIALFAVVALGAKAQGDVTIWWGGTVANVTDLDSKFEPLNVGITYTAPIQDAFDWSVGAGYTTKGWEKSGLKWSPGMIQIEANGAWNLVKTSDFKVSLFTGPYIGFIVAKDKGFAKDAAMDGLGIPDSWKDEINDIVGNNADVDIANTVDFGWQGGLGLTYKFLSLKAGYEFGFTNIVKNTDSKNGNFYFRVGVNF